MKNIEIKARCADLDTARRIALELGASLHADVLQVDTYFAVAHGRLKLRQSTPHPIPGSATRAPWASLIYYQRPDQRQPKTSDYEIVPVEDGESLRQILAHALGVRARVSKRREVFLLGNTRIHLDEVEGLGTFIEFEVVLDGNSSEEAGVKRTVELMEAFSIREADLVSGSYVDLVSHDNVGFI